MKATELMIGDWVAHKDYPDIGIQVIGIKVKDIAIDRIYLRHSLLWDGSKRQYERIERNSCAEIFDIVPIPLTPEILEKNGWKYTNYNNETSNDEEYFVYDGIDIHIDNEGFEIRSIDSMNIQLHYVHILQHIMHLCGIEKEIEL